MKQKVLKFFLTISFVAVSGCGYGPGESVFMDAIAGSAVGAGAGALVGSVISNGDVAMSAALGAAIAIPVAVAASYYYQDFKREQELADNNAEIMRNYRYITERENEIQELRDRVDTESRQVNFDEDLDIPSPYLGATIGTLQ